MKKIILLFLIFKNFIFSAQDVVIREMINRNQEINREERRRKAEAVERFEKKENLMKNILKILSMKILVILEVK